VGCSGCEILRDNVAVAVVRRADIAVADELGDLLPVHPRGDHVARGAVPRLLSSQWLERVGPVLDPDLLRRPRVRIGYLLPPPRLQRPQADRRRVKRLSVREWSGVSCFCGARGGWSLTAPG